MIEKFQSYERAALFIEEKRAEGYAAYLMNESTGFLWGPRTVGGFRVFVSDEPVENPDAPGALGDPLDQPPLEDSLFTKVIRFLVLLFLGFGVLSGIVVALASLGATLSLGFGVAVVLLVAIAGGYFFFRGGFPERPDDNTPES